MIGNEAIENAKRMIRQHGHALGSVPHYLQNQIEKVVNGASTRFDAVVLRAMLFAFYADRRSDQEIDISYRAPLYVFNIGLLAGFVIQLIDAHGASNEPVVYAQVMASCLRNYPLTTMTRQQGRVTFYPTARLYLAVTHEGNASFVVFNWKGEMIVDGLAQGIGTSGLMVRLYRFKGFSQIEAPLDPQQDGETFDRLLRILRLDKEDKAAEHAVFIKALLSPEVKG